MNAPHWLLAIHVLCLTGPCMGQDSPATLPQEVTLKLLGAAGKLLDGDSIRVIFETREEHYYELVTCGPRGRFEVSPPEKFLKEQRGTLYLQRVSFAAEGDRVPAAYLGGKKIAFSDLRKAMAGGPVRLEKPDLAVAGVVVDRQGEPIPGVRVAIQAHARGLAINYRDLREDREVYDMAILTDSQGRFAIHELSDGREQVRLQIKSKTHAMVSESAVAVGARGVKVVMGRTSEVVGKIVGVPKGQRVPLTARLVPHAPLPGHNITSGIGRRLSGGEIRITRCVGGTYDFELSMRSSRGGKPLVSIENIKVVGGEECQDPRMAAIDISKHYRWIEVAIVDAEGELIPRARVAMNYGGSGTRYSYVRDKAAWMMIPTSGTDLQCSAAGFQAKAVADVVKSCRVVLDPAWQIELKVTNLPKLEASQVKVVLEAKRSRSQKRRSAQGAPAAVFGSSEESDTLEVETAGAYQLKIYAMVLAPRPNQRLRNLGNRGRAVPESEHVVLATRDLVVSGKEPAGKLIPAHIELSATQLAVLRSFEAILKERK